MLDPDIQRLPFEEQIKYFLAKLNIPTERWDSLSAEMHDHAFAVAGAMQADLLADLREAVNSAITDGTSIDQFRASFDTIVQKYGWDYTGGYDWRTRLIYTTNLSTSYGAGRYQQLTDPDLLRVMPLRMWKHADGVHNPRPLHVAWDGVTLPAGHPWWVTHPCPCGFGCHCRQIAVTEAQARRKGGKFDAPDDGYYSYTDPRGVQHRIPNGVDPGWDHIPGKDQAEQDRAMLAEKEERLKSEPYQDGLNDPDIRDKPA